LGGAYFFTDRELGRQTACVKGDARAQRDVEHSTESISIEAHVTDSLGRRAWYGIPHNHCPLRGSLKPPRRELRRFAHHYRFRSPNCEPL
jgi:hypothetical protein